MQSDLIRCTKERDIEVRVLASNKVVRRKKYYFLHKNSFYFLILILLFFNRKVILKSFKCISSIYYSLIFLGMVFLNNIYLYLQCTKVKIFQVRVFLNHTFTFAIHLGDFILPLSQESQWFICGSSICHEIP